MTLLYEQIFSAFSDLSYDEKHSLIQRIRKRRISDNTPKKQKQRAKSSNSEQKQTKEKWKKTLDELSLEEQAELIQELDNANKNS